ncbi:MAG: aminodeoxychorismate synthase component I [Planctomycetota bacterium]
MNPRHDQPIARTVIVPVAAAPSTEAVAVIFSQARQPSLLESPLQKGRYSRFSIYAAEPVDVFEAAWDQAGSLLRRWGERFGSYPAVIDTEDLLPFAGGWIGFLSYEAGLETEGLLTAADPRPSWPPIRFALYDAAAVFDHHRGQWYAVAVDWPEPWASRTSPVDERLAAIRSRLEAAETGPPAEACEAGAFLGPEPNMTREQYLAGVQQAKSHIEAGDIYQVNLTQRFDFRVTAGPMDIYRRLRRACPSTHAAFLMWDDRAIISASPELFLDVRGRRVVTRPIKGTCPRGDDPACDAANRIALLNSEKDTAELVMIVDLLRNDLGRVCAYGSVRVTDPVTIEDHPNVFHRVATIEGRLGDDVDVADLLRAAFPGGSITGAPKIRAMQIIKELEPTPRGVYCGAIGYVGLDGSLSLNVAIRTIVQEGATVCAHAGGAIVADSEPEAEYEEVLVKCRGMFAALGCGGSAGSY